jgi:hypothetical protein
MAVVLGIQSAVGTQSSPPSSWKRLLILAMPNSSSLANLHLSSATNRSISAMR